MPPRPAPTPVRIVTTATRANGLAAGEEDAGADERSGRMGSANGIEKTARNMHAAVRTAS